MGDKHTGTLPGLVEAVCLRTLDRWFTVRSGASADAAMERQAEYDLPYTEATMEPAEWIG